MNEKIKALVPFSKTLNVLYVEDNELARENILQFLEHFFDSITVAVDGQAGLESYEDAAFDLIITDINMPRMNGIEMASAIRDTNKEIPILILSAYDDIRYFLEGIKLGIDGYLIKPIDLDQFVNILTKTIEKIRLQRENEDYKHNLEQRVEEEIEKRKEKEKMLQNRSKMAAMGDMIDAVAHQWAQPLSTIKLQSQLIALRHTDLPDIKETVKEINLQIDHLNQTLKEFRTFLLPDKPKTVFNIFKTIDTVLLLMKDALKAQKVHVKIEGDSTLKLNGIENEIKHIFINLINNAIDAFTANGIEERSLTITLSGDEKKLSISVQDNAGGIPEDIIDTLFKPNVSTKAQSSGIGLYMSQQIAQKHGGSLRFENVGDGARCIFELPLQGE